MSKVKETIVVRAPIEKAFDVIADFVRYPDFQPDIVDARVIKQTKSHALVIFTANIVQKVVYTLEFKLKPPGRISWKMTDGGAVIKSSVGVWQFRELKKGLTEIDLKAEMKFPFWIPNIITDGIFAAHVPKMLANIKKRAEKLAKRH